MKTRTLYSTRTVSAAMLIASIFMMASCSNSRGGETSSVPAPPRMDLHTATVLGDLNVIRQHIEAGSDLNEREPTMASTPLISAAVFGKTEAAKVLIEAGADVNLQNDEGSTALHTAAFLCRTEMVKMLLEHGAKKEMVNIYGSTPLATVAGPFEEVEAIYDAFSKNLGALGFRLDYDQLKETRPVIAALLQ